jgi:hypothetical protein
LGETVITASNPYGRLIASTLQSFMEIAGNGDLPPGFVTPAFDLIANSIAQTLSADSALSRSRFRCLQSIVERHLLAVLADRRVLPKIRLPEAPLAPQRNHALASQARETPKQGQARPLWRRRK